MKDMTLETNDKAIDLSRRSMMGRFGLMASLACAAPVLMTVSTSALANHKNSASKNDESKVPAGNNGRGWGCDGNANGAESACDVPEPPPIGGGGSGGL
jgi:hypothetical protein